jgi:hypothetical protein
MWYFQVFRNMGLVAVFALSFAKVPQTVAQDRVVGLRRHISVGQLEVRILGKE